MKTNNKSKKVLFVLLALFLSAIIFAFFKLDPLELTGKSISVGEMETVTKVIDGDTVIISGGDSVRLLGIDADERGYPCYNAAKERVEELLLGKEVYLEKGKEDLDIYGRELRYILFNGENINLKLIQEGFVIARIEEEDRYKQEFVDAENYARENNLGCKWSGDWLPGSNIQTNVSWNKLSGNAILACAAKGFIDKTMIVEGKVIDIYQSSSNTVFINFEKPYPNSCFTAVIFKSDLGKFDSLDIYKNKVVRVKGKIKEYEGKPEMILENEDMIEVGQN
ncbi:MAG: thermonuclease family protein [Candidatus Pacearchaeota archaeon]|nr:thermonuclease family protein [Candidatus Pacearchaeota archaeon]